MGLFWDLIQQSQISDQREQTGSLAERIVRLEGELVEMKRRHTDLLLMLERHFGQDLNQDGRIGS
jgi:hypothetical protein